MKFLVLAATLIAPLALPAAPAGAQGAAGFYRAVPVVQPERSSIIARTTMWRRQGDALVAGQAPERDMIVCQLVAKQVGALTAFSAGGKTYDAAALGQCNAKAKPVPAGSAAAPATAGAQLR